jgi:thiamine-phosphate pyrophosphorylase
VSRAVPRLLLVTDTRRAGAPLVDLIGAASEGGIDAAYLRGVDLPVAQLADLVGAIRERAGPQLGLFVNGDPRRARAAGVGLHLREIDVELAAARQLLGEEPVIGRSVHSATGAAAASGADYVLAGHVFPTRSKPGIPPLGLERLAAIATAAPCPTLAIGGITADRIAGVVRAGAVGIAVIGAIVEAVEPRGAAMALRNALERALDERKEWQQVSTTTESTEQAPIDLIVNGKSVSLTAGSTIHDFLASKRMTDAMAIVERNGEIVPRADYASVTLTAGDRLEVVHAVGGG